MQINYISGNIPEGIERLRAKFAIGSLPNIESIFNTGITRLKVESYGTFQCSDKERDLDYTTTVVTGHDPETGEIIRFGTSSQTFVESLDEIMAVAPDEPIVIVQAESKNYKGKYYYRAIL